MLRPFRALFASLHRKPTMWSGYSVNLIGWYVSDPSESDPFVKLKK